MSFLSLGLRTELAPAASGKGCDSPTPIQAKVISLILEGRDLTGIAQTGAGKTGGFTLPIMQRLAA